MVSNLLSQLNEQQKKAVAATEGPLLILAGAGSGKTRVLTFKVAYLISKKGIAPERILMVTFTNKAAGEMKERISRLIGKGSLPFAGTFHSFAARFLRKEGKYIGIPASYVIYDEQDQIEAIKQVILSLGIESKNFHPKGIAATISQAKNELLTPGEYRVYARGYFQETVAQVYSSYQELLKKNQALDFDDLLFKSVQLLKEVKEVRSKYQELFQYILVDEYQDTNRAQYEMTKLLSGKHHNICIVGDASQSIYSWRGADFQNIMNFQRDFAPVEIFYLEQNYRSTQKILQAARNVIFRNTSHPVLKLWTKNTPGKNIVLYEARNEQDEAKFIVDMISEYLKNQSLNLTLNDFAVLYRTNAQSRVVEEALLHSGIPYALIGGIRFYERREIKDILAFLKFLYNPKDLVSFSRIEKLGKRKLEKYLEGTRKIRREGLENLSTLEILDKIVSYTNYLELFNKNRQEDRSRLENIKELKSVATQFPKIEEFLENVSLVEQEYLPSGKPFFNKSQIPKNKKGAASLLTIHAAKGLEFKVIFIIGMEEGLFPHSQALLERNELEEERRLCYVAITRAKEFLFLTYARRRLYFGKNTSNFPSQFLSDIPEDLLTFKTEYNSFC